MNVGIICYEHMYMYEHMYIYMNICMKEGGLCSYMFIIYIYVYIEIHMCRIRNSKYGNV